MAVGLRPGPVTVLLQVLLVWTWSLVLIQSHEVLEAASGQNVTLQCRGPVLSDLELLEWVRLDLTQEGYVFFFRENQSYQDYQVASYSGRVSLRESSPSDMSIVLREVDPEDTGTYECRTVRASDPPSARGEVYYETNAMIRLIVRGYHQVHTDPGQGLVLPCLGPKLLQIQLLEWSRLDRPGFIYIYDRRNPDQNLTQDQRVQLRDPELKGGDAALILKDVRSEDAGIYACFILYQRSDLHPLEETHHIINVTVSDPPDPRPPRHLSVTVKVLVSGLILGLCAALLFVLQKTTREGDPYNAYLEIPNHNCLSKLARPL